jgi:hypothetical protein
LSYATVEITTKKFDGSIKGYILCNNVLRIFSNKCSLVYSNIIESTTDNIILSDSKKMLDYQMDIIPTNLHQWKFKMVYFEKNI